MIVRKGGAKMANRFRILLALFVVGVWASCDAAQSAPAASAVKRLDGSTISPAEIDAAVTRLMHAAKVTGAGVALFNDGKISYLKAYGFRDKEQSLALTPDTIMIAASLSKSIFAYMVMQLVEEHVIDLDKPDYQYFPKPLPEYARYTDLAGDPRYKKITLRMLLSHTSGFPNWRAFTDGKLEIHFEPGSRFAYSGEGIDLAQFVVETVTGKPLNQLMHERVFDPLGMHNSNMIWEARFGDNFANGYDEAERSLGPQKRKRDDAAGSMLTTLGDYALFLQAVAQGNRLNKTTRELMLSPQIAIFSEHEFPTLATETTDENKAIHLSYGLGWGLYTTPYGPVFFKEGHDDGWRHYAVYFDKAGTGMLIMTNSSNGEGIYKELLETLLKNTYTPIEWESFTPYTELAPRPAPVEHHEVSMSPAVLRAYVGRYQAQENELLSVTLDGEHLFLQENDSPKMELFPEGQERFFAKALDLTVEFQIDAQHRAHGITVHVKGMVIPAKRTD
jgi:CubicO group peptidase (beta-lactamase class C family)